MSSRDQAFSLLNMMTEEDIQMFLSIFGRVYNINVPKKNLTEKQKAFQHLKGIVDSFPPFPDDFDPEKEKDEYFREKYGL